MLLTLGDKADLAIDWRLLGPPDGTPIAVAVSGGADSFSLLHALWSKGYAPLALTVDHGLRPEERHEAESVAAWCKTRKVPHHILTWKGDKPAKGVQAAARAARYRLLIEACAEQEIDRLATGHTLDDQAETLFMRLGRGSGAGLGAMRPDSLVAAGGGAPIRLLRPMLKTARRGESAHYAAQHDLPVAKDPSNDDEGYERIRVRALLRALDLQDLLTPAALARSARRVAALTDAQGRHLTALLARVGQEAVPGVVRLDFERFAVDVDDQRALVARVLSAIGTPVQADDVALVQGLAQGQWAAGGVIVEKEGERVFIYREPAAVLGRADGLRGLPPVAVGEHPVLWDRRYILTAPPGLDPGAHWSPLGQGLPNQIVTSTRARRELVGIPALFQAGQVTHVPKWALGALVAALDGWKDAGSFLSDVLEFEAESLFEERFAGRVIRH